MTQYKTIWKPLNEYCDDYMTASHLEQVQNGEIPEELHRYRPFALSVLVLVKADFTSLWQSAKDNTERWLKQVGEQFSGIGE